MVASSIPPLIQPCPPNLPSLNPAAAPFVPPPSLPKVLSWSQVLTSSSKIPALRKLDFFAPSLVETKWVASCLKSEVEAISIRLEDFVQGFLVGKKPYLPALKKSLTFKWNLKSSLDLVKQEDGSILLKFGSSAEKKRVLDTAPHFIAGHVLALRPGRKNQSKGSTVFNAIPVWVQLPGLPLEYWSLNSLGRIASIIGIPLWVDEYTANLTRMGYARLCVEISATKDLPDAIWICSEGEKPFIQKVVYEWKPKICLSCSSFFHTDSGCPLKVANVPSPCISPHNNTTQLEGGSNGNEDWIVVQKRLKGKKIASSRTWQAKEVSTLENCEQPVHEKNLGFSPTSENRERIFSSIQNPGEARCSAVSVTAGINPGSVPDSCRDGESSVHHSEVGEGSLIEDTVLSMGSAEIQEDSRQLCPPNINRIPENQIDIVQGAPVFVENREVPGVNDLASAENRENQQDGDPLSVEFTQKIGKSILQDSFFLEETDIPSETRSDGVPCEPELSSDEIIQNSIDGRDSSNRSPDTLMEELPSVTPRVGGDPAFTGTSRESSLNKSKIVGTTGVSSAISNLRLETTKLSVGLISKPVLEENLESPEGGVLASQDEEPDGRVSLKDTLGVLAPSDVEGPYEICDTSRTPSAVLMNKGQPVPICNIQNHVMPSHYEESSDDGAMDSPFPPGFIPEKEDMRVIREILKEGASLVPHEFQNEFINSVNSAEDGEILNFFQDKFKEKERAGGDTNFLTHQNLRRSPRMRKKPARLSYLPSPSGLKKGFLK